MRRIGNAERLSRQLALLGRGERRLWRVLPHGCTKVVAPILVEKWGRYPAKTRDMDLLVVSQLRILGPVPFHTTVFPGQFPLA